MSNLIKSLIWTSLFSFTQIHSAIGSEPRILSVKEFQEIKNSTKVNKENLKSYEINNNEVVTLYKISPKATIRNHKRTLVKMTFIAFGK